MDLSKLPRLSKTEPPPAEEAPPTAQAPPAAAPAVPGRRGAFCDRCGAALRPGARFCDSCGTPTASSPTSGTTPALDYGTRYRNRDSRAAAFMDLWLSLAFGVLFAILGRTYFQYLLTRVTHQPFHTNVIWQAGPLAGQEVAYADLEGGTIWSDSSVFVFGVALLVNAMACALALFRVPGRLIAVGIALVLMATAECNNVVAVVKMLAQGITPLLSLVCLVFGGYMLFEQWILLSDLRREAAEPPETILAA